MRKLVLGVCLSLSVCLTQLPAVLQVNATEASQEDENSFEYYEGEVTGGVNVRTGAGTSNSKLMVDGQGVALKQGTIVTIIDSENVGDKPWYKIKFTYKEQELTGYATSSYIKKTGKVITPTPLPEPTNKPTTAPTITVAPTKTPDLIASPIPQQAKDSKDSKASSSKIAIFAILGIGIVGGGFAFYYFTRKSQKDEQNSKEISEKVAKLKDMVIGNNEEQDRQETIEHKHSDIKKKPEVRVCKGDKIIQRSELIHDSNEVYVKKAAEEVATTLELDEEEMINDSAEKKALRLAVNKLKEHDIVIHKFFGKGEVFDNSDVKLIEVRFGGDVRFLNKNQLVNKKLIEITNERKR